MFPDRVNTQAQHAQELVDEAVEESFPASDPPATHQRDDPPANAAAKWRTARRLEHDSSEG